jgi:hypothetical protein
VAALLMTASACYVYVPVDTTAAAPVGKRLAIEITDRGRAALSERIGSGVVRVEGTVTAVGSDQYELQVWKVAQFNTGLTPWSGEPVRIDRNYIGAVFERRVSRARSVLALGATIAAVVWFGQSQGLLGSAESTDPRPVPAGPDASRVP